MVSDETKACQNKSVNLPTLLTFVQLRFFSADTDRCPGLLMIYMYRKNHILYLKKKKREKRKSFM